MTRSMICPAALALLWLSLGAARLTAQGRGTQALPPAVITDSAMVLPGAFERRMKMKGGGKFLTSRDIAKLNAAHTPDLLARVSGGQLRDTLGALMLVSTRGGKMSMTALPRTECVTRIALNEVEVPVDFDLRGIRPADIAALEVYSGPSTIPLELGGTRGSDAFCGLINIWLKERR